MDWQALPAVALQTVAEHLQPSAIAATRLTCQSWRQSLNPKQVQVTVSQTKPEVPSILAAFAGATAATINIDSYSPNNEASSSMGLCWHCQQISTVVKVLQHLPNLQELRIRKLATAQQTVKNQQPTRCSQCVLDDAAIVAPFVHEQEQQLQQQIVHPRNQLLHQLQQLYSLEMTLPPTTRGMEHFICDSLQQLSRLVQLVLHIDLCVDFQCAKDDDLDKALRHLPPQLHSLQLLPVDSTRSSPGSWQYRPRKWLSAGAIQSLAHCKQLLQLNIGLPLNLYGAHVAALQQVLAAGHLTVLQLSLVAWPLQRQQQQQEGQALAAALLASLSTSSSSSSSTGDISGLRSLHLGAYMPAAAFKVVVTALQQLTGLTALQLSVGCFDTESVAALSNLKALQQVTWSVIDYSPKVLNRGMLQLMVQSWPRITGFVFESHVDLMAMSSRAVKSASSSGGSGGSGSGGSGSGGSGSGSSWQLFQQWGDLQHLRLGPTRLSGTPIGGATVCLEVAQLSTTLTSLELANMFLSSTSTQLPCRKTLKQLTISWPWRVNDLSLCAPPCLAGCSQLSTLKLVGVTLEADTLCNILQQHCTQLNQLLLIYVRCFGDPTAGIAHALAASSSGEESGAAVARSRLQLSSLQLVCDKSQQLMALTSVLESVVVPGPAVRGPIGTVTPEAAAAEAISTTCGGGGGGGGGSGGGTVRELQLSCREIAPREAKEVVAKLASCCGGLSRLTVLLYGVGADVLQPLKALTDVCVQTAV